MSDEPERGRVLRGALPMPFGPYTLVERLGVGGMAEVFLAEKSGLAGFQKQVVIKRLLPHLQQQKTFVQMFLREARVAARLSHKNVVQIFELGEEASGDLFIAMEFVDGLTFRALVEKCWSAGREMPVDVVCRVAADAARGLHHLHAMLGADGRPLGLVHRDISPDNLMVSFAGPTKVLDFGIAKPADGSRLTETGDLKGKIPFMSPEQVDGEPLDGRSDLFSLGVSVYWALAGLRPFDRASDLLTLTAIVSDPAPPLSALRPDVDEALVTLVHQLLAKDRTARPAHGDEVADRLERFAPRRRDRVPELLAEVKDVAIDEERLTSRGRHSKTKLLEQARMAAPPVGDVDELEAFDTLPIASKTVAEDSTTLLTAAVRRHRHKLVAAAAVGGALSIGLAVAALLVPAEPETVAEVPLPVPAQTPPVSSDGHPPVPSEAELVVEPAEVPRRRRRPRRAAPRASAPAMRDVEVDGDGRIQWRAPGGKALRRGAGTVEVPQSASFLFAYDTWRGGKIKVPIKAGRARLAEVPTGTLHFRVLPWAEVFLGKERLGVTPFAPVKLPAGSWKARLVYEGAHHEASFEVKPGQKTQVRHSF